MRVQLFTAMALAALPTTPAFAQVTSAAGAPKQPAAKPIQPAARQLLVSSLVGGSDNCANAATADAITGPGTYAVSNLAATSGAPIGTCGAMGNDVWFYYTATATGVASVTTCNQVTADSVLAAWADNATPGLCPTTQITCLDDSCGLQTTIGFPIVSGSKYFIEVGGFNGAQYSGNMVITESVPTGNDDCSLAQNVVGNGPHPFDTTTATTGAQGQSEPLCLAFTSTAIYKDQWFTWTATASGSMEITLCGATGYDSRVAVYNGSGCPTGPAIACNDDSCGLISTTCFSATAGQVYTIQIGAYAAAGGGPGDFAFNLLPPPAGGCTPTDDGGTENSVGWTNGGTFAWMSTFGAPAQSATVTSIETCYGSLAFPGGFFPMSGALVTVAVFDDPNDDFNPNDAVLLGTGTAPISAGSLETDVLQSVLLNAPVLANGVFFIAAMVDHVAGEFVSPLDQSSAPTACGPQSYFFGLNSGTIDLNNINANQFPPQTTASAGFAGNWLLRPNCGPGITGTAYCFGDGSGTACPCANSGAAGNGCASSVNPNGANLAATGSAVVGSDTVTLLGTGMPPTATALYFQGTAQLSSVFGDGLRCVGGTVIRLGTKTNAGGASQYPVLGDQTVSVRGMVPAGATRNYQCWYRNSALFCVANATFNLTNGLQIVWQ